MASWEYQTSACAAPSRDLSALLDLTGSLDWEPTYWYLQHSGNPDVDLGRLSLAHPHPEVSIASQFRLSTPEQCVCTETGTPPYLLAARS